MEIKRLQGDAERLNGIYYEYDPYSTPLGEGGMGIVYKGFRVSEASGLKTVVAIKAMKDDLPEDVYLRARREASIQLKNDNLVEMLGFITTYEQDFGTGLIRRYYVISEFLNGIVLTDLLKGNFKDRDGIEIPYAKQLYTSYISDRADTATKIIKRVLAGTMALHDKGYIHRDIDPSNIMVTKEGQLKMLDFGIAKDIRNINKQDSHTVTGKFIGKAEYAAPELVLGDAPNQNFTTDVYAIGILYYFLLVGNLPFDGPQFDILQSQLKKNVPVSNVSEKKYRTIIKKATAKGQADRFQSCVEMRYAIDNAKPPFDWALVGKVASVAVVVAGLWLAYSYRNPDPNPDPQTETITIRPKSEVETYASALEMLNSEDVQEAKKGWRQIQQLATNGSAQAKVEVGLTLFEDPKGKVEISPDFKARRQKLDLSMNNAEAKKLLQSINVDSLSGEALVALGMCYWREGQIDSAKVCLNQSLEKIEGRLKSIVNNQLK